MRIRINRQHYLCARALAVRFKECYLLSMSLSLAQKIQNVRRSLRINQAAFAEKMGVTQGTVSRWENGALPKADELARIADFAGVSMAELIGADFSGGSQGNRLMVKGEVAAGVWREAWQWEPEDWMPYHGGQHIEVNVERRFGLIVRGDSMNDIYPPGTILDCVHVVGGDFTELVSGQRVIVLRKRSDNEYEATVKEYRLNGGKHWLVPRSSNPAFQAPIEVGRDHDGIEETCVIALVRGSYRPE